MAAKPPRHNVFISYHHAQDQRSKDEFVQMMGDNIVDKSVDVGNIDDRGMRLDEVRQRIRDDYIASASVTIVLIGPCTWRRKHVDWEIGSSLRDTEKNPRCGLLGIFLPNHPDYGARRYNPRLIPPRLADNNGSGNSPYAVLYDWSNSASEVRQWIHLAFNRRKGAAPDNSRPQFAKNRSGPCKDGWQD